MYIKDLLKIMNIFDTVSIWRVWYDEFDDVQWESLRTEKPKYRKFEVPNELQSLKIEIIDVTVNHIDIGIMEG